MVVVVAKEHASTAQKLLQDAGETVFEIDAIRVQEVDEAPTVVVN